MEMVKVFAASICIVIVALSNHVSSQDKPPKIGNWEFRKCLKMSFGARFKIPFTYTNGTNSTVDVDLADYAMHDESSCDDTSAKLLLRFYFNQLSASRHWEFILDFTKEQQNYMLQSVSIQYIIDDHFPVAAKDAGSKQRETTRDFQPSAPVGSYISCDSTDFSIGLSAIKVHMINVKMQPFAQDVSNGGFGYATECSVLVKPPPTLVEVNTQEQQPVVGAVSNPSSGNWKSDCMMMVFGARFIFPVEYKNGTTGTWYVDLADYAKSGDSTCTETTSSVILQFYYQSQAKYHWEYRMTFEKTGSKYKLDGVVLQYVFDNDHFPIDVKTTKQIIQVSSSTYNPSAKVGDYITCENSTFMVDDVNITMYSLKLQPFLKDVSGSTWGDESKCKHSGGDGGGGDSPYKTMVIIIIICIAALVVVAIIVTAVILIRKRKLSNLPYAGISKS